MTEQEILESNLLIAVFMGAKQPSPPINNSIWIPYHGIVRLDTVTLGEGKVMKYHKSWDWIMPCIEKIRKTNFVFIFPDVIVINENNTISSSKVCKIQGTSLESYYKAIVEFIEWYNTENNNN